MMGKKERLKAANEFIKVIAGCGRKFFRHGEFVSYMEVSKHGHIFFIDYYTKKRIYTHSTNREWDGFTSGGTLKDLVKSLRDYIAGDSYINADYYSSTTVRDPWGYGDDMFKVREAAIKLGLAKRWSN